MKTAPNRYRLFASPGSGPAIVETLLAAAAPPSSWKTFCIDVLATSL